MIFVLVAIQHDGDEPPPFSWLQRGLLFVVFVVGMALVFAAIWIYWTTPGDDVITGIQARYFLPLLVLIPVMVGTPRARWLGAREARAAALAAARAVLRVLRSIRDATDALMMRFWRALLLIVLAALALRVGYVALAKHDEPRLGDQIYYNVAANQLARGNGFTDPRDGTQTAQHPPLTAIALTPDVVGERADRSRRRPRAAATAHDGGVRRGGGAADRAGRANGRGGARRARSRRRSPRSTRTSG